MRCVLALLLILLSLPVAEAAKKEPRSGQGPCRIAAQALIGYLDAGQETGGEYAHAYGMVDTCGPARATTKSLAPLPVADRAMCRSLALEMLDELDENRLNRSSFVKVRDAFAAKCGPAKGVEPKAPGPH